MPSSSCLCGKNKISYSGKPIFTFRCHCKDERRLTGAAFALNILYSDETLKAEKGMLKSHSITAGSGNTITSYFCDDCASLLYRASSGYPGTMVIKAGCIDDEDAAMTYVPDIELFTRSRVPWVPAIEGAKQEIGDFSEISFPKGA